MCIRDRSLVVSVSAYNRPRSIYTGTHARVCKCTHIPDYTRALIWYPPGVTLQWYKTQARTYLRFLKCVKKSSCIMRIRFNCKRIFRLSILIYSYNSLSCFLFLSTILTIVITKSLREQINIVSQFSVPIKLQIITVKNKVNFRIFLQTKLQSNIYRETEKLNSGLSLHENLQVTRQDSNIYSK